jgi:hypothetical protein
MMVVEAGEMVSMEVAVAAVRVAQGLREQLHYQFQTHQVALVHLRILLALQ